MQKTAHSESDKVLKLLPTYQSRVEALTVQSDEDLQLADALLGQINDLRKGWAGIWTHLQEKTIKPIRQGLESLYALDRSVDRPLEALASGIKAKMSRYAQDKLRAEQEAERARLREQQRLLDEQAELERRARAAATPQMRGRLEKQAAQKMDEVDQLEQAETVGFTPPPILRSSGTRKKRVARVTDLSMVLVGIIEGTIPTNIIQVDERVLESYRQEDENKVAHWPGIEVVDEIQVVSR